VSYDPAISSDFFSPTNHTEKDNTIPRFYLRPVLNNFKSELQGHPVFEEKEYVEIIIPGNRGTTVDTPVKQDHKDRWPQLYARFQSNQEQATEGTPIEEWAAITRSQAEELRYLNIRTVEAMANLDDTALQKIGMGGFALREKAQRFLEQAAGAAPADALAAKVSEQEATIAVMEQQLKDLLARTPAAPSTGADA